MRHHNIYLIKIPPGISCQSVASCVFLGTAGFFFIGQPTYNRRQAGACRSCSIKKPRRRKYVGDAVIVIALDENAFERCSQLACLLCVKLQLSWCECGERPQSAPAQTARFGSQTERLFFFPGKPGLRRGFLTCTWNRACIHDGYKAINTILVVVL